MNISKICMTFLGTDAALASAVFLNKYQQADLIISSSKKFIDTLRSLSDKEGKDIFIIGLGPGDQKEASVKIMKDILKKNNITWISHIDHKDVFKELNKQKDFNCVLDTDTHLAVTVKDHIKNTSSRASELIEAIYDKKKFRQYDDIINKAKYWFFNFDDRDYYPNTIKRLSYETYRHEKSGESYDSYYEQKYLLGKSKKLKELKHKIKKVGMDSICNVLITGESGTGKTTIAYALHMVSNRKHKPFINVSCANFSESILESELFGYVKGSFTGANSDKKGIFESAHEGTVFLDEIGELPFHLQSKLLKVLQEKKIRRLGENQSRSVDIRVITATNRELKDMIKKHTFREDLFYRISTVEIRTIPFRHQIEDFEYISHFVMQNIAGSRGKEAPTIPEKGLKRLISYSWPGNFRELENVLERAFILDDWDFSEITPDIGSDDLRLENTDIIPLKEYELKYIVGCYLSLEKNKTKTAQALGISLNTLKKYLKNAGVK